MENEHVNTEQVIKELCYRGPLDSEEGKKHLYEWGIITAHMVRCPECLEKVRRIQNELEKADELDHFLDESFGFGFSQAHRAKTEEEMNLRIDHFLSEVYGDDYSRKRK